MMNDVRQRLIFALDVDNFEDAKTWVERLAGKVGVFKVGKQLFTRGCACSMCMRSAGGK
jgi:orotidine-5'-phosphate decarboxylase